jgi:cytochrome c biogenesis protein CcdA
MSEEDARQSGRPNNTSETLNRRYLARSARWAFSRFALSAMLAVVALLVLAPVARADEHAELYYFWGEGCPLCEKAKPFVEELRQSYPGLVIHEYEVLRNTENQERYRSVAARFDLEVLMVPAFFIGEDWWIGFAEHVPTEVRAAVEHCLESGCELPPAPASNGAGGADAASAPAARPDDPPAGELVVSVPFFGTVDAAAAPLVVSTLLVAVVDGFNPCSLWVLTFLLGVLVHTGSRSRVLVAGLVFLGITASLYGLFIAGLLNVFLYAGAVPWVRAGVAVLALAFGAINVKDYFAFRRGLSLTITDGQKSRIGRKVRTLLARSDRLVPLLLATAALAAGITLVELPCTAGLPVVWTQLVTTAGVPAAGYAGLLALYLVVYLVDELAILGLAVFTLRRTSFEERHGRLLKLVGGTVMIVLGAFLVLWPETASTITGTLLVFGVALGGAAVVHGGRLLVRRG